MRLVVQMKSGDGGDLLRGILAGEERVERGGTGRVEELVTNERHPKGRSTDAQLHLPRS